MSINNEAVFCLSRGFAVPRFRPKAALVLSVWWRMTGSNRRPPACKAGALPAELIPRACLLSGSGVWPLVGLVGVGFFFCFFFLCVFFLKKGGDPAAPSDTATLLRLHPSHEPCRGSRPPCGYANYFSQNPLPLFYRLH